MHIMKLECVGKLPFGTYAEMEREGISLNEIDTTDCDNSLESLQVEHLWSCDSLNIHCSIYENKTSERFEVFTAVAMKNGVFWDVMPYGSCKN
jgi:hypothetical protein